MVIEIEAWPSVSLTTFGCTPEQPGGEGVSQIVEPDVAEPDCVRALAEPVGHRQQKYRHSATPVEYPSSIQAGELRRRSVCAALWARRYCATIRNAERLGLGARTEFQGFVWRTPA
jgi:hypothetical protein